MTKPSRLLSLLILCGLPALAAPPPRTELPSRIEAASRTAPLPIDTGAKGLEQLLRKLRTRASLMTIVAHPDDEDGSMLTLESRGRGTRVGIMTLTRGEGGQNIMSADAWDELGLLRTEELLAADRYYNADQYFGTEADFGFSKTLEEAMRQWTHDRVLRDVVRAVRMYRPLVLTSTFIGAPTDGHGHHQVSGEMAQEAFLAAGNPNLFPEQIHEGLMPWQPLKVYARMPFFSVTDKGMYDYATQKWAPVRFHDYVSNTDINGTPATNVTEHEGVSDPILGATYVQIAFEGLHQQRSQIPGSVTPPTGARDVGYHRFGSKVPAHQDEQTFFDGIDTTLAGIAGLAPGERSFLPTGLQHLQQIADDAQKNFSAATPQKSTPALRDGLLAVNELIKKVGGTRLSETEKHNVLYELHIKQQQFNDALALALNAKAAARTAEQMAFVVPDQNFSVVLSSSVDAPAGLKSSTIRASDGTDWNTKQQSSNSANEVQLHVPMNVRPTVPYFHRPDVEQPYYDVTSQSLLGSPRTPYPLTAHFIFEYDGVPFTVDRVVQAGAGEDQPLVIAPPAAVEVKPAIRYVASPARPFTVSAQVQSNRGSQRDGNLRISIPPDWHVLPPQTNFAEEKAGVAQNFDFTVTPTNVTEKTYRVAATGLDGDRSFDASFHAVGYPGLRTSYESKPAVTRVIGVNVRVAPDLKIGYVTGTGDNVPAALENLGAAVHLLTDDELKTADLAKYDCIMLGIRAYGARAALPQANPRLLEYVKSGGALIVQYNSPQYDHNYGPYPYSLTSDPPRVVEEQAAVKILDASSPLFTWPNQITAHDFDNWVEERGHSFMKSWDPHYIALTETHDTAQDPQQGGLLIANYGKGTYVYVAYALYRQLDEGVPGACRLLANLVSQQANPHSSAASQPANKP